MCPADLAMADPACTAHAHRTQDHGSECDGDVFSMDIESQIEYFFFHVLCWLFLPWFVRQRLNTAPRTCG